MVPSSISSAQQDRWHTLSSLSLFSCSETEVSEESTCVCLGQTHQTNTAVTTSGCVRPVLCDSVSFIRVCMRVCMCVCVHVGVNNSLPSAPALCKPVFLLPLVPSSSRKTHTYLHFSAKLERSILYSDDSEYWVRPTISRSTSTRGIP